MLVVGGCGNGDGGGDGTGVSGGGGGGVGVGGVGGDTTKAHDCWHSSPIQGIPFA